MKKLSQQKGFTLVELAIVLTIIGLLIGGILKGQQLMTNARVTATIAQINAINAAITTFRDTYAAMPGDMVGAPQRLPNCAMCGLLPAGNPVGSAGDNQIGALWNLAAVAGTGPAYTGTAAAAVQANENALAWTMLFHAGLLSGITDDGIRNINSIGGSVPAARVGGGISIATAGGAPAVPGRAVALVGTPAGTVLTIIPVPNTALNANANTQAMTAGIAAQIDRKLDDGDPATGDVQAYGLATSCYSTVAPFAAATPGYLENVTTRDCSLYFEVQG